MLTACLSIESEDSSKKGNTKPASTIATLSGTISRDTVLKNIHTDSTKPDYLVSKSLVIRAKVTIEPGVIIEVEQNQGIAIETNGSLNAVGEENLPIHFRGKDNLEGHWRGLHFQSNSAGNILSHVHIRNGGSSGFVGGAHKANITLSGSGRLKMENSVSSQSGGAGLWISSSNATLAEFKANKFFDNATSPVRAHIQAYQFLDTLSKFAGNGLDLIQNDDVGTLAPLTGAHTWAALDVPYGISKIHRIHGDLTLAPGVKVAFSEAAGMLVENSGSLTAVGTESDSIEFSGREDLEGYWKGFKITSNSVKNRLKHAVLSNGGQGGFDGNNHKANLIVQGNSRVEISNTVIKKSGGVGLFAEGIDAELPGFSRNSFKDNAEAGAKVRMRHFHFLDSQSDFTGNGKDYIDMQYDFASRAISGTHEWSPLNVPYRLVGQDNQVKGSITLKPGVRFVAAQDAGLEIVTDGSFRAVGAEDSLIVFEGEENLRGYWKGIRFTSTSSLNLLEHFAISDGGGKGFDGANRKANIEIAGSLAISKATLKNSGGAGIRVLAGADLTQSALTITGNMEDDLIELP